MRHAGTVGKRADGRDGVGINVFVAGLKAGKVCGTFVAIRIQVRHELSKTKFILCGIGKGAREVDPVNTGNAGRQITLGVQNGNQLAIAIGGARDEGDLGFVVRPFRCHEFRGEHQDNMAAFLKPAFHSNAADFTPAQHPFVKPDVKVDFTQSYGQFTNPILLRTVVAEEDIELEAACGHAFWFAGVWRKYTRLSLRWRCATAAAQGRIFFVQEHSRGRLCHTILVKSAALSDAKIKLDKDVPESGKSRHI